MAEETKYTYKVKAGKKFGAQGEFKAGDTVELTEQEAAGFADKLELTSGEEAKLKASLRPRRVTQTVKKQDEKK